MVISYQPEPFPDIQTGPSVEEQAIIAWLNRLDDYLLSQLSQGLISQAEKSVILKDMYDRLYGLGLYEGNPDPLLELPSWIITDVENYTKSLPIAEQKRLDEEAKLAAQKEQNIAAQLEQLPLGAGGTINQQIIAGQNAIRSLQNQMGLAPEYLQNTMKGQIAALQAGVDQLWATERVRAQERQAVIDEPDVRARAEQAQREEPGTFANRFAEIYGMSPKAAQLAGQRYSQNPESPEFANLSNKEKGELAWVGQEATEEKVTQPRVSEKQISAPAFKDIGVSGTSYWKDWFAQRYPSIVGQFRTSTQQTASGWASLLEKEQARLKEEFASLPAYQRGERPGFMAPKVKTVAY